MLARGVAAFGLLVAAACSAIPVERVEVSAMSFNIRYATARDGPNRWDLRKDLVLRVIREHSPDLLGLQEALPKQTRFVAAGLPEYASYFVGRRGALVADESCAVFYKRDRFELVDRGTFWLSTKPDRIAKAWDAALPRICSWLRLRDLRSGRSFVFANTHFDHRGRRARAESAALIAARWPGELVVLTGDLNAGEQSKPLEALRAGGFVDSFRVVHPDAKQVGTFCGFRRRGTAKIDYVLLRGEARVSAANIVTTRYDGRWPSDHLPVTASLVWR